MSKQSEVKAAQNYTRTLKTCSNCKHFMSDKVPIDWDNRYTIEKNLRCGIGGFKVHKTGTCDKHEQAITESQS